MSMEQKWREEQRGKTSWFWSSFASSFTSTIAENLQVRERGREGERGGGDGGEEGRRKNNYFLLFRSILTIFIFDTRMRKWEELQIRWLLV